MALIVTSGARTGDAAEAATDTPHLLDDLGVLVELAEEEGDEAEPLGSLDDIKRLLSDFNTAPDGAGIGTGVVEVRAERQGSGNGRVYEVQFTASADGMPDQVWEVIEAQVATQDHQPALLVCGKTILFTYSLNAVEHVSQPGLLVTTPQFSPLRSMCSSTPSMPSNSAEAMQRLRW